MLNAAMSVLNTALWDIVAVLALMEKQGELYVSACAVLREGVDVSK